MDEGYIKFHSHWTRDVAPSHSTVADLLRWRNHLHALGLIGIYPDGIGYGNISMRSGKEIIITGTQTGGIEELDVDGCTMITEYDIDANSLHCRGPVEASSESLTHAAIYACEPRITAVIHVHHLRAWESLLGTLPTTRNDVPYGTPAMAHEIERLFQESDVSDRRVLVMGGHREGIIAFGRTMDETGKRLLEVIARFVSSA